MSELKRTAIRNQNDLSSYSPALIRRNFPNSASNAFSICSMNSGRLMTSYVNVREMGRPGSVFDGNTMSLFQMRFQIKF